MPKMDMDTLSVQGLEDLAKALKHRPPKARIGILGVNTQRKGGGKHPPTNAEIGAAHEYGAPSRGLPARSFLRMPISTHLQKKMEGAGALNENTFKDVMREKSVKPWLSKVAALALTCVQDAFNSAGFGQWAPWKPGYANNTNQILVNTTQLRDSITWDAKE